ncbi:MAG: hypothetical protein FJW88_09325 [Actinobacteria bacterium]|nr:hypothetical protein [Actinomycetota bacterium]
MPDLEALLVVQEHDTAADHLRHRRATLHERDTLAEAEAELAGLAAPLADAVARRDDVERAVLRLEDEVASAVAKASEVDKVMYSGTISSPKELQNMQAEIEQLQRYQRTLEDRELELMERQEALGAEVTELERRCTAATATAATARAALGQQEAAIDAELAVEASARAAAAGNLPADLLALYGRCRERARGIGAARLVGHTCQGCRLTIPATEVDRIRRTGADAEVAHCDNCGAILVPST